MREQREKKQNGQKGDKRFERKCCISRGEARLDSGGIKAGGGRGGIRTATVRCNGGSHNGRSRNVAGTDAVGGAAPGMIAAKSPEYGEGEQ